jgi:hypothetical protein
MIENQRYLVCKRVRYCSRFDEDTFFEWIKKIPCIYHFEGAGDELYLDLLDRDLKPEEIIEIIALFRRYYVNMKQLAPYKTEANKHIFDDFHKEIFGKAQ